VAVLPASPCSARSLNRSCSISAGVHFWALISRAVSRIIAFLFLSPWVINHCLGAAFVDVSPFSWEVSLYLAAEAAGLRGARPAAFYTSAHFYCAPPAWN